MKKTADKVRRTSISVMVALAMLVLGTGGNAIFAPQTVGAATPNCVLNTYQNGSYSACVGYLQRMLNSIGSNYTYAKYQKLNVDSSFGPLTRGQVYAFQSFEDIGYDGIVGRQTWHALCLEARNNVGGDARIAGNLAKCNLIMNYW
ncbi:MAG TPA: peptidoglycan-binding domain-containing protein [Patescibacteria group bacterium]|nr:peptidoglycan-binding domain-containing protein [Patescibacteria group bacterium]